jgi:hypothetical protein
METAIIIVLLFMLLIAVIILLDINFDRKAYKIIIQDCSAALDKSKKENEKLKSKIADFKKSNIDLCNSKIIELETKYQSALNEIFENKEKIKSFIYEINKYDKCNKQIAEELIKKNNIIEDSYTRIKNMDQEKQLAINQRNKANEEKQFAIHQSKSCIKLCNEMSIRFKLINSELEAIELQLLQKLNP